MFKLISIVNGTPALHPFIRAVLVRRRRKEGQKGDKENLFDRSRVQSGLKFGHCKQNISNRP